MLVKPAQIFFQTKIANDVSLDFSFVNVYFFYLHGDNGSGISNVVETNKNLNTKQNHWVVPIRWHLLVFSLFRTIALFLLRNTLYFVLVSGLIGSQHENVVQLDHLVVQKNHKLLKPSNVWCEVCIQTWGDFSRWWFFCTTRWSNCMTKFSHSC